LVGSDTILHISSNGTYSSGVYTASETDLNIKLSAVNLIATNNGFEANSINELITNGNLVIL
jgi:hypothetical protein